VEVTLSRPGSTALTCACAKGVHNAASGDACIICTCTSTTHGRGDEVWGQLSVALDFERIPRPEHARRPHILRIVLKRSTTRLIIDAVASGSKLSVFQTVEMGTRAPY
jgi:hypothetical protein